MKKFLCDYIKTKYEFNEKYSVWMSDKFDEDVDVSFFEDEKYLYDSILNSKDKGIFSDELRFFVKDDNSKFAFSDVRTNILRPVINNLHGIGLEIGSEYGCLSYFLSENCDHLFSFDRDLKKSCIASLRCNDLINVDFIYDKSLPNFSQKLDFVVMVGTFDFSNTFGGEIKKLDECINYCRSILKDDGIFIFAFNNDIGLKKLLELKENNIFSFNKNQVIFKLEENGFKNFDLYYPFPDYVYANLILSSNVVNFPQIDVSSLICASGAQENLKYFKSFFFNEELNKIVKSDKWRKLSNSFLIVASPEKKFTKNFVLSNYYSTMRRGCYAIETRIVDESNSLIVKRNHMSTKKPLGDALVKQFVKDEEYFVGTSYFGEFKKIVSVKDWTIREISSWAKKWIDYLIKNSKFDPILNVRVMDAKFFDCYPGNIIIDSSGKIEVFDLEWHSNKKITLNQVVIRGMKNCFCRVPVVAKSLECEKSYKEIITEILKNLELNVVESDFVYASKIEEELVREVFGGEYLLYDWLQQKPIVELLYDDCLKVISSFMEQAQQLIYAQDVISQKERVISAKQGIKTNFEKEICLYKEMIKKDGELIEELNNNIAKLAQELNLIKTGVVWRVYSLLKNKIPPSVYRIMRCLLKLFYWFLTPHKLLGRIRYLKERKLKSMELASEEKILKDKTEMINFENKNTEKSILFVLHAEGGGTESHVCDMADLLLKEDISSFICKPSINGPDWIKILSFRTKSFNSFSYDLNIKNNEKFEEILTCLNIKHIHIHHLMGYGIEAINLFMSAAKNLKLQYDITIHDYMTVCPRINMVSNFGIFCGEHGVSYCESCIQRLGSPFGKPSILEWRERFSKLFDSARRLFVPNQDVKERMERYFPQNKFLVRIHPEITLEKNFIKGTQQIDPTSVRVVALLGVITEHKGASVFQATVEYAKENNLSLKFVIVGYSDRDDIFRSLGVEITGKYKKGEEISLLSKYNPDIIWYPAVCPETYSYTLSVAFMTSIYPVAFNLGAISQRIKEHNWGGLIPVKHMLSPEKIAKFLLNVKILQMPLLVKEGFVFSNSFFKDYYGIDSNELK